MPWLAGWMELDGIGCAGGGGVVAVVDAVDVVGGMVVCGGILNPPL